MTHADTVTALKLLLKVIFYLTYTVGKVTARGVRSGWTVGLSAS